MARHDTGIGASPPRKEDARFLTGAGRYSDDLPAASAAHLAVVRSPHPHARIRAIGLDAARRVEGVLAAWAFADIAGDVKSPIPSFMTTPPYAIANADGTPMPDLSQPVLAHGKVRYLGEPVAVIVAESVHAARDGAEAVHVDYEVLDPVQGFDGAGPPIWDEAPGNESFHWSAGDAAAVERAFDAAHLVVHETVLSNRVCIAFMEPRAALAEPGADGTLTLTTGAQSAHGLHGVLAPLLGLEPDRLRVRIPDTGGGFGARGGVYPEFVLVLVAARRLGRAIKWTAERGESFVSDTQSRDHRLHGELAIDATGRFTALRVRIDWRHGAYVPSRQVWVMLSYLPRTIGGCYAIPCGHTEIRGVISNTVPEAAYRGIGRVESTYLIESLVERAAVALGTSAESLRRSNVVGPAQMPWRAPGGNVYTSGEFATNLDRALALAGDPEPRRARAESNGRLFGRGMALYVENDGGAPSEFAEVEAHADGTVTLYAGTQNFGMGHETVYAQVLSERLGIPFDAVRLVDGDTARVARGFGSHGSRSMRIGGGAAVRGAEAMVEQGLAHAAALLEAAPADIRYAHGAYHIPGTDRATSLANVAAHAAGNGGRLAGEADFHTDAEAHSNGCHVCDVEVDPQTGRFDVVGYFVVADVGTVINPTIVHGQVHGGALQGIGQAAMEGVSYDPASGQTLTGSFMDYTLPRADDAPPFVVYLEARAEPDNPLGVKGAGEGATTGAPAAVMNALRDAVRSAAPGTDRVELDMPATPERVWRALAVARA